MLLIYIFVTIFIQTILTDEILKFSIEEKSPINTFLADLSNQLPIKTNASYILREFLSINQNLFTIDNKTGYLITTTTILDRDQMCLKQQCSCNSCQINFQLIIQFQQTMISKIIQIQIQDQNDHAPIFEQESMLHFIHIKENVPLGYRIILPTAYDPDEGLNSIQSYHLSGQNSDDFDIDYSSIDIPYLIVRSSLDHQRLSSYSLTLIASDNHYQSLKSRFGSIQLHIHIINESMPIFIQSVYHIDIREDTLIGTSLLKIEAISDNNQEIFYELLTKSSPFIIDRLTGNIQLNKFLDYETNKSYRLIVKAYENSISSYAILFIKVIDVNDNPVLIQIKTQGNTTLKQTGNNKKVLFIPEDTPIGTTVGHVILNDLDSYVNGNPYLQLTTIQPPLPIIYKLIYQNNFQNTKVYSLILHTKLDRELKSVYNNIQLLAYDSGTPTFDTKLSLSLNITDINDCIPQIITNSTIYNINENNPLGLIIDTLIGYDCDLGVNSQYEYSLLNQTDLLIINPQTGQMSLNQSIDFENLEHRKNQTMIDFEFLVQIHDFGQPSLSSQTKIILRIHDLNDHAPIFDQNQSYNWTYSSSVLQSDSILGQIFAYDNDSGLQGIVHYSILALDSCLILSITSLGFVYLQSSSSCSDGLYRFEIIASDYGIPTPRLTKQNLFININSNEFGRNFLPKIYPLSTQRIIVDRNSIGHLSFILDITTNQSIQPRIYLNNTDWNINSTGEVRLINQPEQFSYILLLNIIDEYTEENLMKKLQIDLCDSLIKNSCERLKLNEDNKKESEILLFWAISLALIITCICIVIFSIIICLCCRKENRKQQQFLQYNEGYQSEKTYKTSSGSTIREDDRDSACIIPTNSSMISPIRKSPANNQNYQSSTYFYDLKLAELIRHNPNPPCVYLNSQSFSSDYGFGSCSQVSRSSSSSCASIQFNQLSQKQQFNKNSFISKHEYVV